MQYLLTIVGPEFETPRPGDPGFDEYMAPWIDYAGELIAGGHLVASGELQPSATATTIRRAYGGGDTVVDGPFAETKEQLGGFYLIEATDLDEALALAARIPIPAGAIEVRPVKPQP
jgi:hypothetical protein